MMSRASFTAVMERTYERGLPHMLTCVRPYDELTDVHKTDFYDELASLEDAAIGTQDDLPPQPASELEPQQLEFPGAGFDPELAVRDIATRYANLMPPVSLTLPRLAADEHFLHLVAELRGRGWKDWHLLTAIANITVNARAVQRGINMTTTIGPKDLERFRALMFAEEVDSDPQVPPEMFSADAMGSTSGTRPSVPLLTGDSRSG